VKVSARLLTGLLGAAATAVLAFGVWPTLLGPTGLDLGHRMVPMPAPQSMPYVTVQADDGLAQRWQAGAAPVAGNAADAAVLFPWKDTSDGTRDAATGLPPVELAPWQSMELTFWAPTWPDRLGFAGPQLAAQAVILLVLWLLWRIIRTVSTAEVFTPANARRMVGIGLAVAVGGSAVQLLGYAAHKGILARSAAAGIVDITFSFSYLPLVIGAIVLLLAEVFRQGVRLRAEVDGLI
jgi:hypothetical protein